jgi:predicted nucleic acid-binding protein
VSLALAERPAVNASPLIHLAGADLLDLLRLAAPEIVITRAVADEIRTGGAADAAVRALDSTPWLTIVQDPAVPATIQAWDLGAGESSVLAWAHANPGTLAILDDLAARRCAATLRIPVRGTLGLVLVAKRRGRIDAARPLLEKLRESGMYLSDSVLNGALALVGE